jgi:glutamate--cysteine ligase
MGRRAGDGRPIPYDGDGPTVLKVLELILERRGGEPLTESGRIIGIRGPWGAITLEPGGQVEWSSMPQRDLDALERAHDEHLDVMRAAASELGFEWLDVAVDPVHSVAEMPWMPKARYEIMRDYFRAKGRLAHRMMTQTASIQCTCDYVDATDWTRKFKAAAILSPVATAMFANSRSIDGKDSGYVSYRQAIWRETDDDRCGLPPIVFGDGFGLERWVDWLLDVPLLFRRQGTGLAPPDGSTFRHLLEGPEGPSLEMDDWATHCSSIFTEVRCYGYLEVRCADLQPDGCAPAVPTFWTAMLYDDDALDAALDVGAGLDHAAWQEAMDSAARHGLDGVQGRWGLRDLARRSLGSAVRALERGVPCSGDGSAVRHLESLASRLCLDVG